jgi:hypothetical protein
MRMAGSLTTGKRGINFRHLHEVIRIPLAEGNA